MSDLADDLLKAGVASWLVGSLERLARSTPDHISPYLVAVGPDVGLPTSRATCRCRFVMRDPQGPRVKQLIDMLATRIVDYCIPRSRIEEAAAHFRDYGSSRKFLQLQGEARDLFTKLKTSGEGGELLLYALLESELGLPQLICKMALKTDSQMHVHGTDGVHAKGLPNGNLALYWAESKLYASVNDAIDAAIADIAPYLQGVPEAIERDLLLVRDYLDTGDEHLTQALVKYFDAEHLESTRVEYRGACLVGFSLEDYPDPFDRDGVVTAGIEQRLAGWHARLLEALGKRQLVSFEIEIFCVPLPSVKSFRDGLKRELGLAVDNAE